MPAHKRRKTAKPRGVESEASPPDSRSRDERLAAGKERQRRFAAISRIADGIDAVAPGDGKLPVHRNASAGAEARDGNRASETLDDHIPGGSGVLAKHQRHAAIAQ